MEKIFLIIMEKIFLIIMERNIFNKNFLGVHL